MGRLLERLLGRLPIGWLQLSHSRTRMAAALAGVAFANILVFVQLGILGALNGTVRLSYVPFDADLLVSSSDARTLTDGSPITRRYLAKLLADPGVTSAAALYLGKADWRRSDGSVASLTVYGLPVDEPGFLGPIVAPQAGILRVQDAALVDRLTRGAEPAHFENLSLDAPVSFEINGTTLRAAGALSLGGGFSADGALVVSDQTFMRLFPQRSGGTPSHILVRLAGGENPVATSRRLRTALAGEPVLVRSLEDAIDRDLTYQTTQRPTGVIFGFGVVIGAIVGIVIVYQVLSTDVADHLKEYATFKAMGYPHRFFLGIVFEEAVALALLGFVPGLLVSLLIYAGMSAATGLPVAMDPGRAIMVLLGTVLACSLSGALATRRLQAADPAELF